MGQSGGMYLNGGVREAFSNKESFEQNLNEMRGQVMLMGEECSGSRAKALGFVQAKARGPMIL